MINEKLLKNEEKAIFQLRDLYHRHGYLPFKINKFEEYDFYVRNKDFLFSDRLITFNDTDGKLMAFKPDVTLSAVKNGKESKGCKQRLYYNENIYRVSGRTHHFTEILQTGIECIGDIDGFDIYEVVSLAGQSLNLISDDFVLDLSHLGILTALFDEMEASDDFKEEATLCIQEKNLHDLERVCIKYEIPTDKFKLLADAARVYGSMNKAISRLEKVCEQCNSKNASEALEQLKKLCTLLGNLDFADKIRIDCSMVSNLKYYNGIVIKGFLNGISEAVLSGGQYDKLMQRFGKKSKAIGFGINLDLLEGFHEEKNQYDVDVLLIYEEGEEPEKVANKVQELISQGYSVSAQKSLPPRLRARTVTKM
ncbi:MAG: ATP phosphoribosyltransferase regulatory subunit [Anaerovoracaceae bacterium]